jgi:hypothetical protein
MRFFALAAATAIALAPAGVKAVDLAPPPVGVPGHGVAPSLGVAPPPVIVAPAPVARPRYSGAPFPPAVVSPPAYGVTPPVSPPVGASGLACAPGWRCEYRGCGWRAGCAPRPELYSGPYGPPAPQVYSDPYPPPASEPYSRPYGPQVYSGPTYPYLGDQTYRP